MVPATLRSAANPSSYNETEFPSGTPTGAACSWRLPACSGCRPGRLVRGQLLRSAASKVDELVDGDRTAQLQGAVAAALRDSLPGSPIGGGRAQPVRPPPARYPQLRHPPRQVTDGDIEVYFAEDKCGLLFLEAHFKRLAEITVQVARSQR